MNLRQIRKVYQRLLLIVIVCILPIIGKSTMEEVIGEKKIEIAMRMIGHEILMSLGDCESRIMPIEKVDGYYKIPFEFNFGFDPDDIVSIVDQVMKEANVSGGYLVEVVQCESKKVVHSFMIGGEANSGMVPCRGRALPVDCYSLFVTIFDEKILFGNMEATNSINGGNQDLMQLSSDALPLVSSKLIPTNIVKSGIIYIPLLFLITFAFVYIKNRSSQVSDPNLVLIGASQFDKRNMALSYANSKVELSNKEAELLSVLHNSVNTPIEREVILQRVWGDDGDYVGRTLDVFISKLRKKLEADTSVKIVNIRGIGYKLVMDNNI